MTDHKETDSKNNLSAEEVELWREVTRDVDRMEGREYLQPEHKKTIVKNEEVIEVSQVACKQKTARKVLQGTDVDRNTMRRLKRGEVRPEARLDLHGMNQGEARQALIGFIRNAQILNKRCVLVVTGKGNTGRRSDDWLERKPGVLKQNVPLWLKESELGGIVLQAVGAQPRDGGDGALYVYLRRLR